MNISENKKVHILVGFGESLSSPEVCFLLREENYRISAFTREKRKCSLRFLDFVDLHEIPAPEQNAEQTLESLGQLVRTLKVDAIMPLDDSSLWICARLAGREKIEERCKQVFAGLDAVAIALDKGKQIEAAKSAGLDVPATIVATTAADVRDWTDFPCIAKPALAVTSRWDADAGLFTLGKGNSSTFCNSTQLMSWITDNAGSGPFLVQKLIRGVGEGVFGHFQDGKVTLWSGHKRIRMMNPHGSGSSACVSKEVDASIKSKIENFLIQIGWSGLFLVELLRQGHDRSWFMELNGRSWGSMALARRSGLNYPDWAVRSKFAQFEPSLEHVTHDGLKARHIGRDFLHLLYVFRGPQSEFFRKTWPGRLSTLQQIFRPHSFKEFYNFHPDYPTFFLRDGWQTIRNFFLR